MEKPVLRAPRPLTPVARGHGEGWEAGRRVSDRTLLSLLWNSLSQDDFS